MANLTPPLRVERDATMPEGWKLVNALGHFIASGPHRALSLLQEAYNTRPEHPEPETPMPLPDVPALQAPEDLAGGSEGGTPDDAPLDEADIARIHNLPIDSSAVKMAAQVAKKHGIKKSDEPKPKVSWGF